MCLCGEIINLILSKYLYAYGTLSGGITQFYELDPTNGNVLQTIDIDWLFDQEGDIAFRSDGVGFSIMGNNDISPQTTEFWTFDLTTGTSQRINADVNLPGSAEDGIDGLDFDANGILFGLEQGCQYLYTLDQTTGEATPVGETGITECATTNGLTFSADGTLYASGYDELYRLDPSTGTATFFTKLGLVDSTVRGVSGLAYLSDVLDIPDPSTVPEPSTLLRIRGNILAQFQGLLESQNQCFNPYFILSENMFPAIMGL